MTAKPAVVRRRNVRINVRRLFTATARLHDLPRYEHAVLRRCGLGARVVLTGEGPIWLYLRLAHALHGKASRLTYASPEAGDVLIFDHESH